MLIGVVGTFAAGKDTVAEYLVEHKGFVHQSTGDLLRTYMTEHQLGGLDRDNLRVVGNRLRAQKGAGFLVNLALANGRRPMVISGIRSPGEVESLRQAGGDLLAVDAPVNRRFRWAKARGRIDDQVTSRQFAHQEAAEEGDDPSAANLTAVIAAADYDISNEGTLPNLYRQVDEVLHHLAQKAPADMGIEAD